SRGARATPLAAAAHPTHEALLSAIGATGHAGLRELAEAAEERAAVQVAVAGPGELDGARRPGESHARPAGAGGVRIAEDPVRTGTRVEPIARARAHAAGARQEAQAGVAVVLRLATGPEGRLVSRARFAHAHVAAALRLLALGVVAAARAAT